ncbi:MAG TPA: NAD(P)-dependent oxidoreductase [Acidimicrobiales bacterium]|nr:NAD(P)-dependent oxidoreductase [Acidimicrobiales bacterium]
MLYSGMVRVLHHLNAEAAASLAAEFPSVEFVSIPRAGTIDAGVAGDVLVTSPVATPSLADALGRGVKWVHLIGTGVDRFPLDLLAPDVTLSCSRGGSAIAIAEWSLTMMLAFEKRLPHSWFDAPPDRWFQADLGTLYGKTLAVVGLGGIGERTAALALPFGMRVKALRRSLRPADTPGVEVVGTLAEVLDGADHVLIAAPLTHETRHLINAESIAWMKPGVHIVNIARGGLIDQDALRSALDSGYVARASLDTVEPEPLPDDHWLYSHPAVRLSPHISWSMPHAQGLLIDTFRENLRRYLDGRSLAYVVDVRLGY